MFDTKLILCNCVLCMYAMDNCKLCTFVMYPGIGKSGIDELRTESVSIR